MRQILQRLGQLADETGGRVIFPVTRPRGDIKHVGGKDRIHRLIADGRRAIEQDQVIGIIGQPVQKPRHGAEEGPFRVQVAILRAGEFHKGRIRAAGHDVDGRPGGRLDEIRRAQRTQTHVADRGRQLAAGQGGSALGATGGTVHAVGLTFQIAGHDAPDGVILTHIVQPHRMGQRRLRVEIDDQNPVSVQCGGMGEMQRHRGFSRTALEVGDGRAEGALAFGARRHQRLATDPDPAAQLVDLVQREPALAPILFDFPEGKVRIGGQLAAKGGLVDAKDQFGHLPAGKAAQRLFIRGAEGLAADPALHLQRLGLQPR